MKRLLLAALVASGPAVASQYVPPPIMPLPDAWQGRAQAVIRVLDKLDAHIETLTLKAGETGRYRSLGLTIRSCMDRPDGLPRDSAAYIEIADQHGDVQPFAGWTFSAEPAIGVFESPLYGVQLVACQGDLVAPMAPPLPDPVPPPAFLVHDTPAPDREQDGAPDQSPGGQTPDSPDAAAQVGSIPDQPAPAPGPPDPVYPDGAPPPATQPPQP